MIVAHVPGKGSAYYLVGCRINHGPASRPVTSINSVSMGLTGRPREDWARALAQLKWMCYTRYYRSGKPLRISVEVRNGVLMALEKLDGYKSP